MLTALSTNNSKYYTLYNFPYSTKITSDYIYTQQLQLHAKTL